MSIVRHLGRVAAFVLGGMLVACGDDGASSGNATPFNSTGASVGGAAGAAGGPATVCTSGQVVSCACAATDLTGTQTCQPDGGSLGPCLGCPGGGGAGGAGSAGSSGAGAGGAGGNDPGTGGGSGNGGSMGGAKVPFGCPSGGVIQPGLNTGWKAGDLERSFYADFPEDTSQPMAVVFSFHGLGDSAANFRKFSPKPSTTPDMPFVLVTPESTKLTPFGKPQGLDWQLFSGASGDANREGDLVESILGCLAASYPIDGARLYSMGFSAGAITTNMLSSRYPDLWAATLAFSGAWFNDPAQVDGVNTLGFSIDFSWQPITTGKGPMLMLTHGGPNDSFAQFGQQVINFENAYQSAEGFLEGAKRTFVDCGHTSGHTPHPKFTASTVMNYFKAHRAGEPSPYVAANTPTGLPTGCKLHAP